MVHMGKKKNIWLITGAMVIHFTLLHLYTDFSKVTNESNVLLKMKKVKLEWKSNPKCSILLQIKAIPLTTVP